MALTVTLDGMRPEDARVFARAAGWFRLYILVRATNPASLPYMSLKGYSAKRLDCKAKTADLNAVIDGREYETAGLVVDPTVVGHQAFQGGKHVKAMKEWAKFAPKVSQGIYDAYGAPTVTYYPGGGVYGVQMDRDHKHFGCVMISPTSLVTAATYIHGDYDLYGIVDSREPTETVFVRETRLGETHVRSKELLDVQIFINSRIGRPMILHGDQEKYAEHSDEDVYAFFPDGERIEILSGRARIEFFYATELKGRKTGGQNAVLSSAGGLWQRVT